MCTYTHLLLAIAANIIVAEKANKIDPTSNLDFFKHYKVCFWVTLLSCAVGGVIIVLMCGAM